MVSLKVLLFLLGAVHNVRGVFDYSLIEEFYKVKHCTMLTLFTCVSKKDQIQIAKHFMANGIRLSMFNLLSQSLNLKAVLEKQHYPIAIIADIDCEGMESFLIECGNNNFFYDTYRWLIFAENYNATEIFQNVELAINAEIVVAVPNSVSNWTLLDVYNPSHNRGGELKVKEIGFYNKEQGYNTVKIWNKYYERKNMTGTTFFTSMVNPENTVISNLSIEEYLKTDDYPNINTFCRSTRILTQHCQELYNFSMNKSFVESWGFIQSDGEVDGLIKELKDGTVDFGIGALLYKDFRIELIDYGYGGWVMKSAFIFRHPKNTASSYELYLRPLDTMIWILIIVALVLMVLVLRLVVVKENKLLNTANTDQSSWSFLIIYNIGELCQQGFSYIPFLASGRIVVITVLIFFFLIYQFYSASVVSFLLLTPKKTITTLSHLLKSDLGAGAEAVLYDVDYFKTTKDPLAIGLFKKKVNKTGFLSTQDGLNLVKSGGFAFHTQTSTSYPMVERQFKEEAICELAEVQLYKPIFAHTSLSKNSPLREMFMFCNVHQAEVGLTYRLKFHWAGKKPQCVDPTLYIKIQVGLQESYWALLLWAFGVSLSIILLTFELMWKRMQNNALNERLHKRIITKLNATTKNQQKE